MKKLTREAVSPIVKSLPPSGIRKFFDLVAEMDDVVSLGIGEPDFVTPWHIREASIYSLERGYTMYTSNFGLLELREAIADDLQTTFGLEYNPRSQVLITVGVSEAMDLAMRAIIVPGDEVIVPEPCYVSYKPTVILAGGKPVTIATKRENNFKLTALQIKEAITPRTKAIILCYPNNPTGATIDKEELEAICRVAVENDLIVISDEIYGDLTYEGQHTCTASLPDMLDRTILLNGFSKAYAMTGWRIGYAAGNPEIIGAMMKIHQYTMLCAPIMAQKAAIEAIKHGRKEKHKMIAQYDERRRLIVKGLRNAGLDCFEPRGAFYAFPSIEATGMSSEVFCEKLLREEKVAVVPGNAFGESGEGFVRCSYAASVEDINKAVERISGFIKRNQR